MKEEFIELYKEFTEIIEEKNGGLISTIQESDFKFASKEMLSLLVSECLKEDIDTILSFKSANYSNRYVDAIIRNVCEQVIEYIYTIKNQELIEIYFGSNMEENFEENKGLFESLKQTGQARFGKRASVKRMATDIGESVSNDEKISLYDIFSLKAELEHNSYFHHIFDLFDFIAEDISVDQLGDTDDLDYIYLIYILTAFMDTYTAS